MIDVKYLQNLLEIIEEPKNQYPGAFKGFLQTCDIAGVIIVVLWNNGEIGDNERYEFDSRIKLAKKKAIDNHKNAIKRCFYSVGGECSVDALVDSIYGEIFG